MYKEQMKEIYLEQAPQLYRYIYSMVKNKNLAEDILQDTFCMAMTKKEEFENHPNQAGWLYRTAYYFVLYVTKKQKRIDEELSVGFDVHIFQMEDDYERIECEQFLRKYLSEEEFLLWMKYHEEGYTSKELAREESTTEGAIRTKICRIKKKLEIVANIFSIMILILLKYNG